MRVVWLAHLRWGAECVWSGLRTLGGMLNARGPGNRNPDYALAFGCFPRVNERIVRFAATPRKASYLPRPRCLLTRMRNAHAVGGAVSD